VAKSKGWTFNGISPALGAYKIVNTTEVYGATGVVAEMGNPPENYNFTGVSDLDTYKDYQTFAGITGKYQGYDVAPVGIQQGITGIQGFTGSFNNLKHGF
jgi:hypothetical protein